MIAAFLLALTARHQNLAPRHSTRWHQVTLGMPAKSDTMLVYQELVDPLDPPKKSPKKFGEDKIPWEFPWMVQGYTQSPQFGKRMDFLVYSQEHHQSGDKAPLVTRMLLRLWDFNIKKLALGHNPNYDNGRVTVYLCFGGRSGGEQLFGVDPYPDPFNPDKYADVKVNTIYIYDSASFTDPVEMAREVAHEYGHAVLPPINGFTAPEEYADGYLGEKFYLKWMRDAIASGLLTPDDAMGADKDGLDKWLSTHVDPLIEKAAQIKPTPEAMSLKGVDGMNAYLGLALCIEQLYPTSVFARSLKLTSSEDGKEFPHARDYPPAAVLAAEELEEITLKIPPYLVGKKIWIPVGTGKVRGAKILAMDPSGWFQIVAGKDPVIVTNTPR